MSTAEAVIALLRERGWTIGVAESLTGGDLVSALVSVPGASNALRGGVVAYATPLKHSLLGVDAALLAAHGAVHPEVARQMAEGVRAAVAVDGKPADVGVSTTGVAGPDPQDGQPVGTVHIAVATAAGTGIRSFLLEGDRPEIRRQASDAALHAVHETLLDQGRDGE
ncbi:CinA family protein [Microbacterium sp. NIBRBAC000506063]|uniref:CinA family protein n=1 Tax=Microbacterium sp. NIBRBAC000506063 TaxID=2734618 RepID=UPI001BB6DDE5|nr:CinA family protein [Microbacterium sp. NIBRBAC000506063]QTV79565.1 CinA family protein [Microbacterium sp. NIBRBAC000506063]